MAPQKKAPKEEVDSDNEMVVEKKTVVRPTKKKPVDEDESMQESSEEESESESSEGSGSESESEDSYSESSDEDPLFDYVLTSSANSKKVLESGDFTSTFAIDVAVHAAKLGAEIRKKSDSLRIVGDHLTLKMTSQDGDSELITSAFEEIGSPDAVSSEAKLLALLLAKGSI